MKFQQAFHVPTPTDQAGTGGSGTVPFGFRPQYDLEQDGLEALSLHSQPEKDDLLAMLTFMTSAGVLILKVFLNNNTKRKIFKRYTSPVPRIFVKEVPGNWALRRDLNWFWSLQPGAQHTHIVHLDRELGLQKQGSPMKIPCPNG